MKLPADSEIPLEKLTHYLLVLQARADKSKFLARAGYSIEDAERLIADMRLQILPLDAAPAGTTKFGDFFEIRAAWAERHFAPRENHLDTRALAG
jgi:hypothetical protein